MFFEIDCFSLSLSLSLFFFPAQLQPAQTAELLLRLTNSLVLFFFLTLVIRFSCLPSLPLSADGIRAGSAMSSSIELTEDLCANWLRDLVAHLPFRTSNSLINLLADRLSSFFIVQVP